MNRHVIQFGRAYPSKITARHGPLLRELLDVLGDGCMQATRLHVDGRSTAAGTPPEWLESASAFEVAEIQKEAVVLESYPLSIAAPRLAQHTTFAPLDLSRSCLDLFEDSLQDALSGRQDSNRYDRALIETLEHLGRLFRYDIERIDVINGRTLRVDAEGIKSFKRLSSQTPPDRMMALPGTLEPVGHGDRTFELVHESGERLWGIAISSEIRAQDLAALAGAPVMVEGSVKFRPSGSILRIEAKRITPVATDERELWQLEEELRRMLEEGRVEEARQRIAVERTGKWGHKLEAWAKLLAPPTAIPRPRSGPDDSESNHAWLRAHKSEYPGQWVALRDGKLVDHDQSFLSLRQRLREQGIDDKVFYFQVGG